MVKATGIIESSRNFLILAICAIVWLFAAPTGDLYANQASKEILVIHSYHPSLSWTRDITKGMEEALAGSYGPVNLNVEYMDARRYRGPEYRARIDALLLHKLDGKSFDLVMVSDNDALDFIVTHRKRFFPRVPIVFCGVNNFSPSMLAGEDNITGVAEDISFDETLALALRLHPGIRKVVVIGRTSVPADRANREAVLSHLRSQTHTEKFVFWDDLPMEELRARLQQLDHDTIVMINGLIADKTGAQLMYGETTKFIRAHSSAPLYSFWDVYLGYGIMGGKLVSSFSQGKLAGTLAARVLKGENPGTIPVISGDAANAYMFDYRELARFRLTSDSLPAGSTVIKKPASFYVVNKIFIWTGFAVLLVFLSVIVLLIFNIMARRKAEGTLIREQRWQKAILDNVPDLVWLKDRDGRIISVNESFSRAFGFNTEEIAGKTDYDIFPAARADGFRADDMEVMESRAPKRVDEPITGKDGEVQVYETIKSPVLDGAGMAIGTVGSSRDITERKIAEEALYESEERYRTAIEHSNDGVAIIKGEIHIYVNRRMVELFGYDAPEDLVGKSLLSVVHPEDREQVAEIGRERQEGQKAPSRYEFKGVRKDGTVLYIEVSATKTTYQGEVVSLAYLRDVTERKEAEETLREQYRFLQVLMDSIPLPVFFKNREGVYLGCNKAFKALTGLSDDQILGKTVYDAFAGDVAETYRQADLELLAHPGLQSYESFTEDKEGTRRTVIFTKATYEDREGSVTGLIGTMYDITDRKRLEAQLIEAQKMQAIGTLAGGIAHDFNNLLMGIQGYTSLMLLDVNPDHPHYERLKSIERQVQSGADLTKQLLGFARGGKYEIKPTNLNDLIESSSAIFGRTRKEIIIHKRLAAGPPTADVDRSQIEQVLLNIYVNAWHAMPTGGELIIRSGIEVLGADMAAAHNVKPGTYAKIWVTDTGVGMDQKTMERIFEPFFTTKEMGRGTGLGLASVYGIIKNHGGIIEVFSEKGHGATFTIYLPASHRTIPESRPDAQELLRGSETILLVDDQEMVLTVSAGLLEALGYRVLTAGSGDEAAETYRSGEKEIGLVILDMIMPGMSGSKTYEILRTINPQVKVLVSSGYSLDGEAAQMIEQGCRGFIQKPFALAPLSKKIRELLAD